MRPRKAPKPRTAPRLQRLVKASAPGQVWAIDFQFDSDWRGRVFKVCNLIDEFTRQHLAFRVERRMGAADVIEMLDLAALTHGAPQVLRADNGPEFIAAAMGRCGGVWVFRTVCFERVVLSSPGCLWPGRMDDHEEVLEAHA